MSRVGRLPIKLSEGVTAKVEGGFVKISGPRGTLEKRLPFQIGLEIKNGTIFVSTKSKNPKAKSLHGTYRALISNMVKGVSQGWSKQMELVGAGYRAEVNQGNLFLTVGYSHSVKIEAPLGIVFKVEKNFITVEGTDKEVVGQISAKTRSVRPPEPYKGKGIVMSGEVVRKKPGKAAKAQGPTG